MNIFQISFNNVRRNFENYLLYFISIAFSTFAIYTVNVICFDKKLAEIVSGLGLMLLGVMVMTIIAYTFIGSSNKLFIEKRKSEIGMYNLLGITKRKIGLMFIYEGVIITALSLIVGMGLGTLFSKLFAMLLLKLMHINQVAGFCYSSIAIIVTTIIIVTIVIINSFFNYVYIKSTPLIKLFNKEKEKQVLKKFTAIKGILGLGLIITGYVLALSEQCTVYNFDLLIIILFLVCIGTQLFFSSTLAIILKALKKLEGYYKAVNMISISEIAHKLRSNAQTLTSVAILIATAVTALGVTFSLYYDIDEQLRIGYNFSNTINETSEEEKAEVDTLLSKYENKIESDESVEYKNIQGSYSIGYYVEPESRTTVTDDFDVVSESRFNEIRQLEGKDIIKLNDDNEVYLIQNQAIISTSFIAIDRPITLNDGREFNAIGTSEEPLLNELINRRLLVVKDSVYESYKDVNITITRCINVKGNDAEFRKELDEIGAKYDAATSSYLKGAEDRNTEFGAILFIGVLITFLLIVATGSLILFKQVSNIFENKERFITLRKIGANEKHIGKILVRQTSIIFIVPLLLGTLHSIFAVNIMGKYLERSVFVPMIITLAVFYIFYAIFYVATIRYSKKVIV